MNYQKIQEIKNELNQDDISLLMLQDLEKFIQEKIKTWGTQSGKIYRII
jgi:hypothetical protein